MASHLLAMWTPASSMTSSSLSSIWLITVKPSFVRIKLINTCDVVRRVSGLCIHIYVYLICMTISMDQKHVCLGIIPSPSSIRFLLNYTIPIVQCYFQPRSLMVFTLYHIFNLIVKSHYERLTNCTWLMSIAHMFPQIFTFYPGL